MGVNRPDNECVSAVVLTEFCQVFNNGLLTAAFLQDVKVLLFGVFFILY
ncbi:hypothetical protein JOD02_001700 [Caldicoprobacter guelmensis]|nr:hypothetical protein [Caldicoprobacter guelmensis]